MAKRRRKRRGRGRLILIAIALIITGFVVRRTLLPQFLHYLAYRPTDIRTPAAQTTIAPVEAPVRSEPPATAAPVVVAPIRSEPSAAAIATPAGRRTKPPPKEDLTEQDRQQLQDILRRKGR